MQDVGMDYHTLTDETRALDGITFTVSEGEFVSIIGPSGCGKSTILSLIAGLLKPTRGSVELLGEEVTSPSPQVGYMFQSDHLFPWRNVRRNILLGLEVQKHLNRETAARVDALIKSYGLEAFSHYNPNHLSGGMRQRAALIRTLATDPMLLLLDEPFSALDSQTRLAVSADMSRIIRGEKKTAVLITHDIAEAIAMADRVIVLTQRPATIKAQYDIELTCCPSQSPIDRRQSPEFKVYFDKLWKELDVHVD
ncbi:MAG: ABC transporter ATP-binding protein [Christensenellales bacterium]